MKLTHLVRMTVFLIIAALLGNQFAYAANKPVDPAAVKARIESRGVGQGVRVTLQDKTEQKGIIVSIGDQSFSLKAKGAAQPVDVSYAQVKGVHKDKMGTGVKVAIVVGLIAAAVVITGVVVFSQAKI